MQAVHRIEDIFVSRNLKGKGYEKSGKIAKAKELYEANVRDLFLGSHPYERLRIIYTRERQYANAIRICETYMKLLGSEEEIRKLTCLGGKRNLELLGREVSLLIIVVAEFFGHQQHRK